jgi:hypothetical protein
LILIRCWPEWNNDGKFDILAKNLWSLASKKCFSCVLARNCSVQQSLAHYALLIVSEDRQTFAEDFLRKRNYAEFSRQRSLIDGGKYRKEELANESEHNLLSRSSCHKIEKYTRFAVPEGTLVNDMIQK